MRVGWIFAACIVLVNAVTADAASSQRHLHDTRLRHLAAKHPARKESAAAGALKFAQQFRINQADKKAREAIANGDMDANRKYLAKSDKLRDTLQNKIPAIRLAESAASQNIPGVFAAAAHLAESQANKAAAAAVRKHVATGGRGTSAEAVSARKVATAAMYAKKAGNVADIVNSGVNAVGNLANGAVNAAVNAPNLKNVKNAGKAIAGTGSAAFAGAMGAVGLAKQANIMGMKTKAQTGWANARAAVKLKAQVMPVNGKKPAPLDRQNGKRPVVQAPSAALDKNGLTTSRGRKIVNSVKDAPKNAGKCTVNCFKAIGKAVGKVASKAKGH